MNDEHSFDLNAEQVRVLACLMEKHLATPNNYPLTPNSLKLACNQKSNRFPIMSLEEGKVVNIVQQLNEMGYSSIDYGERINKFSHRAPGAFGVSREEQAVLAILMLREPLTLNEIKARTQKMVGFESIDQVQDVADELKSRSPALVMQLPQGQGQREQRYTHLLAGEPDLSSIPVQKSRPVVASQSTKITQLEMRIERLEKALDMTWEEEQDA